MGFFERLFGKKTDEPPPPLPGDGEDQAASSGLPSGVPPLALGDVGPGAKGATANGKKAASPVPLPEELKVAKPDAKPADPKTAEAKASEAKAADPKAAPPAKAPDKKAEAAKPTAAPDPKAAAQAKPASAPDPKAQGAKPSAAQPAPAAQAKGPAAPQPAPAAQQPAPPAAAKDAAKDAGAQAAGKQTAAPPAAAAQAKAPPALAKPGASASSPTTSASPAPGAKPPAPAAAKPGSAPAPGAPQKAAASKDLVDELIHALDGTFVESAAAAATSGGTLEVDRAQVEVLFAEIAAQYARPVKEFIVELRRNSATRDWIDVCRPALSSIAKAARSMNLESAAVVMDEFDAALKASAGGPGKDPKLNTTEQKTLLERYDKMVEILPKAFSITEELRRRDGIIINALLKQIPDVGRVTLDKLYAAGLTSMDVLLLAKKDELAAASGVSPRMAEQICQKLREYQEQSSGTKRVDMKAYRKRLTELLGTLKTTHAAFVKADGDPGATDEKRRLRGARQNLVFQISIVLAELGEAEFVKECDKLTFERRIMALDEFLARTAQRM